MELWCIAYYGVLQDLYHQPYESFEGKGLCRLHRFQTTDAGTHTRKPEPETLNPHITQVPE